MKKEIEIPKRLVIRNSKFGFSDLFYIGLFLFLLYIVIQIGELFISIVLLVVIAGFVVIKIIQRLNDNTEQIVIDENGITLKHNNNDLIKWEKIKFAYIKQTVVGSGKSSRVIDWFHIETTREEFTVKMSDFSYKSSLLTECINYYSGRKIGHISNKLNYGVSQLLKNKKMTDELYPLFNNYFKRQYNLSILFLLLVATFLFLQLFNSFPYVFAIGLIVSILILFFLGYSEEKRLYNQESLRNLDKKIIEKIKKEFGYPTSEKNYIFYSVFIVLFIISTFVISYILSK